MTIQPEPFQPFKEANPYDNPSPAIKQTLNPNVGQVNPALYAAGARVNLTREERNLIETWSSIKGTHEKLMNMDNKKAAESFKKLNPEDQQTLTSYYKVDYANKANKNLIIENPSIRKLLSLDDGFSPGDLIKSPFRLFMGAAGIYERAYNAPYTQALATVTNRENFWSRSNFEMSFDGEFSYDEKLKQQLIGKYGEELSFAAMHLLAGKTPGEIIDAYGPNSAGILQAVNQVFNEPDKIAGIMDEFDRARLSPGRGVARWINKTFGIDAEKNQTMFKVGSGAIDLAFQIFADPMTYLTAGSSNIFKAEKLTKALITSRDTVAFFADPKVAKYFEGYATKLGEYSAARKAGNSNEAAKIREYIGSKYSDHGTDAEIELWTETFKVTNFDRFKDLFLSDGAHEFDRLIQGRVNSTAFSRTNAVYAKASREFTFKAKEKVKEVFRGKAAFDQLDEAGTTKLLKELSKVDDFNYSDVEKTIQEVNGKGAKKLLGRLEYQFSLHPGTGSVFTNERYIETIETVRRQANLVFKNKPLAHLYTEHFKSATITERKFLKKNLDELTLRSTGMYGMPGGKQYAENILDDKYGEGKLFGVQSEITMPPQLGSGSLDNTIRGPLGSSGFKEAYSALPFQEISQFVAHNQLKEEKKLNARTVANIFGGAYNSKVVSDFIDFWSQFTLFPQLGVRSSIDEGFMLGVTQNPTFIKEFFKAQKYGKIFPVIGGSNKSVGPIKDTIDFVLGKLTKKDIGPVRTISPKQRNDINAQIDKDWHEGLYTTKKEADDARILRFADIALAKYGKKINEKNQEYLTSLARHKPQYLNDVRALKVFNATLNKENLRVPETIITKENFDKSLELAGLEKTGIHRIQSLKNFADEPAEAMIFHNFGTTFNQGPYDLGPLNKRQNLDAARLFIANNALETTEDADRAVAQFLKAVGFIETGKNVWVPSIQDAENIKRFIDSSSHFLKFDGLSDAKKVEGFIRDVFSDFYVAFHGSPLKYNSELVKVFKPFINGRVPDHRLILKKIDRTEDVLDSKGKVIIPSFSKMIKDYKPEDLVTDLDVQAGYAKNVRKFGNRMYEGMARTNDDMVRSPAVQAHYLLSRGQSEPEEINMAKTIAKELIDDGMEPYLAFNHGSIVADEFFTSRAVTEATNRVLKYVDNPDIRTVFAYNIKTIGRFYRAVEDFHRRVYRLVEGNKLNTIYRLRLMNQGLDSLGEVHQDANGEKYLILPVDDVIYSAVDGTLRMLTNDQVTFKQPLFNDITFNVTAGNPSFQTDAGMPYLSGPAASLSIMAVRSLLGKFDTTAQVGENLDEWTLGSMGDNVDFRNAVTPKFVNNVWKMLSPDERNQQEVSAYVQALSYNQANDLGIDPTDYYNPKTGETDLAKLDEDKRKYLDTVKISAHNIIVTRALLGMILPFAVQTKDTKDLPTYLKDVGVVSMKTSFYELFDQIKLKYPDIENPYELTLATWMGQNPGKVAYVVNTNQETVKPLIKYSEEMQSWVIANKKEIEKYGNGAMMFAPNTGEFSPGVYKWAEAVGITSRIPANETARGYIEKFYEDLMFKEHVNAYYDINDREEADLRNVPFESADLRRASLNAYTELRKQYKIGVPGIADYIDSGRDITDSTDFIQSAYNYVNAPEADVKPEVKQKINQAYEIFNNFISDVNYIESLDPEGAADMKRARKAEAQQEIKKLIDSDTTKTVEQYYNYGLLKVMNNKSRDARPAIGRNVVKKVGN